MAKLTTEEFIKKTREVHGDKYDYSKVEYVSYRSKVCIICPKHGEFWQRPIFIYKGQVVPSVAGQELQHQAVSPQSNFYKMRRKFMVTSMTILK